MSSQNSSNNDDTKQDSKGYSDYLWENKDTIAGIGSMGVTLTFAVNANNKISDVNERLSKLEDYVYNHFKDVQKVSSEIEDKMKDLKNFHESTDNILRKIKNFEKQRKELLEKIQSLEKDVKGENGDEDSDESTE